MYTRRDYNEAYADGARAMREAIKANLGNLKKRMEKDKSEGKIPLAIDFDIDNHFKNLYNFIDIRVEGEEDRSDPDA